MPFHKPLRLSEYDYSLSGYYFVTICAKDRQWILWEEEPVAANCVRLPPSVVANCVRLPLSPVGSIVEKEITVLSQTYEELFVDKYIVMPNHIHLIIGIRTKDRRSQIAPTVSRAIKQFKGSVTKQIGYSIWQKSYYDHIIRDEADYLIKWNYIDTNPDRWAEDEYYER